MWHYRKIKQLSKIKRTNLFELPACAHMFLTDLRVGYFTATLHFILDLLRNTLKHFIGLIICGNMAVRFFTWKTEIYDLHFQPHVDIHIFIFYIYKEDNPLQHLSLLKCDLERHVTILPTYETIIFMGRKWWKMIVITLDIRRHSLP